MSVANLSSQGIESLRNAIHRREDRRISTHSYFPPHQQPSGHRGRIP